MKRWMAGALALCMVGALTGCKGNDAKSAPATKVVSHQGYLSEYTARKKDLSFPKNYPANRRDVSMPTAGEAEQWEAGAGEVAAVMEWNCAWAADYVTAPSAGKAHALWMFENINSTREYREFPPDTKKVHEDLMAEARSGNAVGIAEFARANCPDLLGDR